MSESPVFLKKEKEIIKKDAEKNEDFEKINDVTENNDETFEKILNGDEINDIEE